FHNGTGREESEGWEEIPEEAASRDKKKKHAKKSIKTYKIYIFKVLNQIYPDIRISSKAMGIMNKAWLGSFKAGEVQEEADDYILGNSYRCEFVLPGELAKHVVSERTKAVT
ncbi:hypothetical protein CUMW_234770, partial [Citrus unshiu]